MRERDLRKQALGLESGKTLSRKARSKLASPLSSAAPSRGGSRAPSRNPSDDEGDFSDETQWSTASIDEVIAPIDAENESEEWKIQIREKIDEVLDRKRSSVQGREECLQGLVTLLTRHYAAEETKGRMDEVVAALLKSIKTGQTEKEVVLSLKALVLLLVTDPSDAIYDAVAEPVKTCISNSQHPVAKAAAIHTLGVATFYGGATTEETEETMEYLLDIVSSDGAIISETNNGPIVTAALEEWGTLATQIEDLSETSDAAMEVFIDQLDSTDVDVQVATGENIALLFEKSYTEAESDDEIDDTDQILVPNGNSMANGENPHRMIKRYSPLHGDPHLLISKLEALAKTSSKRLSKSARKQLHVAFSDVLNTVEVPTRGPRYSTALDEEGREMGSRLKVAVGSGGKMTINTWWKLHRLNALKRLLREGFLVHYEQNQVVFDSLPVVVEEG